MDDFFEMGKGIERGKETTKYMTGWWFPKIPASTRDTTRGTSSSMIPVTEGFVVQLSLCRCCRRCRCCVFWAFWFLITFCNPL